MNHIEAFESMFADGVGNLWRSVQAMPEDKLTWKPAETSRTAREVLEELVFTTAYCTEIAKQQAVPKMGEDNSAGLSLEELEKAHRENVEAFLVAFKAFPEDKLQETIELPWGKMTFFQALNYVYWNLMYHWGQINYIQTMYGDKDMR